MSRKLFGEFLIEQKLINEGQLVAALVEQQDLLPTISKIVHENKIIDDAVLLKILSHQTKTKLEFKKASEDLGIWNEDVSTKVFQVVDSIRMPLGEILVKQGVVNLEGMTKALDEFLSGFKADPQLASASSSPRPKSVPVSLVASEEFLGQMDAKRKSRIDQYVEMLKSDSGDSELIVGEIYGEFHTIQGAVKALNIEDLIPLVSTFDEFLAGTKPMVNQLDSVGRQGLAMLTGMVGDLVWKARECLKSEQSLDRFWQEQGTQVDEVLQKCTRKAGLA